MPILMKRIYEPKEEQHLFLFNEPRKYFTSRGWRSRKHIDWELKKRISARKQDEDTVSRT